MEGPWIGSWLGAVGVDAMSILIGCLKEVLKVSHRVSREVYIGDPRGVSPSSSPRVLTP